MFRLAADENFDGYVVRRLKQELPDLDLVRIQDTVMYRAKDPAMLEWVANEGRILLTHDLDTVPDFAYERVKNGKVMPGVFAVPQNAPRERVVQDLLIAIECSLDNEWENQILHFPLKS